jgi:hypothetical protein
MPFNQVIVGVSRQVYYAQWAKVYPSITGYLV